ncbi:MAG: OmpA family protein [Melioribacteraceae bacterium]|nr:OmpA family protein [Melioribacteraceae bacterium]MCF8396303.1 OmpA family protein [Melioribacteraceae bacterium]MCF8421188.1 OmpA family protein [Melioribacteraceae bacterium]
MKPVTLLLLVLFGFTQFITAQEAVETPKNNSLSNVIGLSAEFGLALAFSDYASKKLDFNGKGSIEYTFASTGNGNFGLRAFGQKGFISGTQPPAISGNTTNEFSTKFDMFGGGLFYILSIGDAVYPWAGIGLSNIWFYPRDGDGNNLPNHAAGNYSIHMLAYNGDVGARIMVSDNMSVNINAGAVVGTKDWLDDVQSGPTNDLFYTLTAGLTYYFGRDRDSDGDGVPNSDDVCLDTPLGVRVDEFGCPMDVDHDGVADYLDKCSDTPAGVKVDRDGCPPDFDRDGVPDYLDKCSNTPAGIEVDQSGCPLDEDNDGVADNLDRCPDTPSGVKVDRDGCMLDADGDGVADNLDKCPNTPAGVQVDSKGCPLEKEKPAEIESIVLSGDTNFEFNKSKLLPNAYAALEDVVSTMKEHPEYKWEIGGHTDAIGSSSYNTKLSKERAQSVVDYLLSKGVNRNSLIIVGYGESSPIATNDTDEGRSMNRRVEIRLLSKK